MKSWIVLVFITLVIWDCSAVAKTETEYTWFVLDVTGFRHIVSDTNVLILQKALIRDDGECNWLRGDGDIGLHIYHRHADSTEWIKYKVLRLYGHNDHGEDELGEKYEWRDNHGVTYKNYGLLTWDDFPGAFIRFQLIEGDHGLTKDDVVFDEAVEVETLKTKGEVRIDGNLERKEATLWLVTDRMP